MTALSPHGDLLVPNVTLPELLSGSSAPAVHQPARTDADTPVFVPWALRAAPSQPIEEEVGRLPAPDVRQALSVRSVYAHATRIAVSLLAPPNIIFPPTEQGEELRLALSNPWPRGGVVSLFSTNQHDYATVVLGLQLAGAIPALCNPAAKPVEFAHQLLRTRTKMIIASNATYETALRAAKLASGLQQGFSMHGLELLESAPAVLVFDEDSPVSYTRFLLRPLEDAWTRRKTLLAGVPIDPWRDDALYCFSSGTSGLPKALRISHRNLVSNVLQLYVLMADDFHPPLAQAYLPELKPWAQEALPTGSSVGSTRAWEPVHPDARHLHIDILPTFHAYGLVSQFVALYTATPRIVFARFGLELFLKTVQEQKATFAYVVPPILLALAQHPLVDHFDMSSLKHVASGAAPLSDQIKAQVYERIGTTVTDGWGLSEMTPIVSLQNITVAAAQPGGVGNLAPGTGARVVDLDSSKDVPAGTEGEILLRGPQMMLGYLGVSASQFSFEGHRTAEDSGAPLKPGAWLKTGDIGCIDAGTSVDTTRWADESLRRGQLRLTSRVKDVIKMHGFQVSPKELEDHLFDSPWVADAAIVGLRRLTAEKLAKGQAAGANATTSGSKGSVPHGLGALVDEVPWAFIVASAQGKNVDVAERSTTVLKEVNGQVAGYKKLYGVEWVDSLPKSASGKILKRELRENAEKATV